MNKETALAVVEQDESNEGVPVIGVEDVHINLKEFLDISKKPVRRFWHEYGQYVSETGDRKHIFIDNGAPILAVAHLDTVVDPTKKFNFNVYTRNGEQIIKCPTLDDRLGVYIILKLMPELLGEKWADILLTDLEESGKTTAADFINAHKNKQYNWIVEFDRAGIGDTGQDDAVLYSYMYGGDANEFKNALSDVGFKKTARGSFTDISAMQDLGVKAFNVGVAYYDNHSTSAYMKPYHTRLAVSRFVNFYIMNSQTKYKHVKTAPYTYKASVYKGNYGYGHGWQSNFRFNDKVVERGMAVKSAFAIGDIVCYVTKSSTYTDRAIYYVDEIYLMASGDIKYDLRSISYSYTTTGVDQFSLQRVTDVCYYCMIRTDDTYPFWDNCGKYYLCNFCADVVHEGQRQCELCLNMFDPPTGERNLICPSCMRRMNVKRGDVVVFDVANDKTGLENVPFFVTFVLPSNNVVLWDGVNAYRQKGKGYDPSMFVVIERDMNEKVYMARYGHMVARWMATHHTGGAR